MPNFLTDANVNFHFEYEVPENHLMSQTFLLENLKKGYEERGFQVKKFFITTLPLSNLLKSLSKKDSLILGLYLDFPYNSTLKRESLNYFSYLKIRPSFLGIEFYLKDLKNFVEELYESSNDRLKFLQIHVEKISTELLESLKELTDSYPLKIQLVHGIYALYRYHNKPGETKKVLEKIRDSDKIFLGTSNFEQYSEIPHPYLKNALSDGLIEQTVYESDFILGYPYSLEFALGSLEGCYREIGYNSKIFYENSEKLLK